MLNCSSVWRNLQPAVLIWRKRNALLLNGYLQRDDRFSRSGRRDFHRPASATGNAT